MRRWLLVALALPGCLAGGPPAGLPAAGAGGWAAAPSQEGGDTMVWERPAGWIDFGAVREGHLEGADGTFHLDLPLLGPVPLRAMPHGRDPAPGWVREGDGWRCCEPVEALRMRHGGVEADPASSLEWMVTPAGVEGILGVTGVHAASVPAGDYLLHFRLAAEGGHLVQQAFVERVDCRGEGADYTWIYGCGREPFTEGSIAP